MTNPTNLLSKFFSKYPGNEDLIRGINKHPIASSFFLILTSPILMPAIMLCLTVSDIKEVIDSRLKSPESNLAIKALYALSDPIRIIANIPVNAAKTIMLLGAAIATPFEVAFKGLCRAISNCFGANNHINGQHPQVAAEAANIATAAKLAAELAFETAEDAVEMAPRIKSGELFFLDQEKPKAATKIQSVFRGHLARKAEIYFSKHKNATKTIDRRLASQLAP